MKIDIWSDIICPFCAIGDENLKKALEDFPHKDDVKLQLHSFELDPHRSKHNGENLVSLVAQKYGTSQAQAEQNQEQIAQQLHNVGIEFNWQQAKPTNTFMAHRLVHLAEKHNLGFKLDMRLKKAYLSDAEDVSDPQVLKEIAQEVGLNKDEVDKTLSSDEYAENVRQDEAQAQAIGVQGVPFFVFDEKYAVSGAQPVEVFKTALETTWKEEHQDKKPTLLTDAGTTCSGDSCSI